VAETTVKRDFYAAGFDALVSDGVEDMSRNKCFFQVRISPCFTFYPFVTYLLTLPRKYTYHCSVFIKSIQPEWKLPPGVEVLRIHNDEEQTGKCSLPFD
jgi:hypothetical protein